jgi:predicted nucleic acid-binding protein
VNLALDTSRYSDLAGGDGEAAEVVEAAGAVYVPLPVLAELRAGFVAGSRVQQNEAKLAEFLAQPGVVVLLPDEQTTRHYAAVCLQLRHQGTPIPTNDMWIAAMVIQHGLVLYARDAHFDHLPQIARV